MGEKITLFSAALCLVPALWAVDISQRSVSMVSDEGASRTDHPALPPGALPLWRSRQFDASRDADTEAEFAEFQVLWPPVIERPEALSEPSAPTLGIAP